MAFTETQKVAIRRFCGFPAYATFGWVFEEDYATLELRMNGMSPEEEAVITTTYLPPLSTLETDILAARCNLDTAQAAVWTRNSHEIQDRSALFDGWRRRLCGFIGVNPGRGLRSGTSVIRT